MRRFVDKDVAQDSLTSKHRGHTQLRLVEAVPGMSCRLQGVGRTGENRIWRPIIPAANRQVQIPFSYSVYTVSLIFRTETQELGVSLRTGYAHSWLLEIVALKMHPQQSGDGATGRVIATRREGDDHDTRNLSVV